MEVLIQEDIPSEGFMSISELGLLMLLPWQIDFHQA